MEPVLRDLGFDEQGAWQAISLVKILTSHQNCFALDKATRERKAARCLENLLKDQEVQQFLQVNRHQEVLWFNKEAFESLAGWLFTIALVTCLEPPPPPEKEAVARIAETFGIIQIWLEAARKSGYRVEKLMQAVADIDT
jgi:hypothetical protein